VSFRRPLTLSRSPGGRLRCLKSSVILLRAKLQASGAPPDPTHMGELPLWSRGPRVGHGVILNLFRVGRHLLRPANHRMLRARSFLVWHEVTYA